MAEIAGGQASIQSDHTSSPLRFLPVAVFCLGLFALYHETLWSMVQIWESSKTYKHGYIIAPITLWLIWDRRKVLQYLPVRPVLSVTALVLLVGPVWLLASLVDVNVVKQVTFVALLIIGVWAMLGHTFTRAIAFPLAFLFFAVPAGDVLVPAMMEFTAMSTVWLVKMTGIPVYREGLYFTLPSGHWSVVYACSGVRYLIAAVTLGVLYAYLTYRSLKRRILFSLCSVVVPVLANSARAYIIVMLGHLSDMKIATGVDHLLYGWVFFGIVMFLLFWLGTFWREDIDESAEVERAQSVTAQLGHGGGAWAVLCAALLVVAIWPALSAAMQNREAVRVGAQLIAPQPALEWRLASEMGWNWSPERNDPDREITAYYISDDGAVALFVGQHLKQEQGRELVSGLDLFIDEEEVWHLVSRESKAVDLAGESIKVDQVRLSASDEEILIWSWYRIGSGYTSHRYMAELLELREEITFSDLGSAHILVATSVSNKEGQDQALLAQFIADHLDAIEAMLADGLERE